MLWGRKYQVEFLDRFLPRKDHPLLIADFSNVWSQTLRSWCAQILLIIAYQWRKPILSLQLRRLDLELSRQQYQAQLLHIRAPEQESQIEIKLKELELVMKNRCVLDSPPLKLLSILLQVLLRCKATDPFASASMFCVIKHKYTLTSHLTKYWVTLENCSHLVANLLNHWMW